MICILIYFPPKHEGYFLLGFKNLLNYHYLIAELLTATNIDASTFYSYNDEKKASLIWNELFEKRTPVSEACAGVLSILKELNIEINNKNFYLFVMNMIEKFNQIKIYWN